MGILISRWAPNAGTTGYVYKSNGVFLTARNVNPATNGVFGLSVATVGNIKVANYTIYRGTTGFQTRLDGYGSFLAADIVGSSVMDVQVTSHALAGAYISVFAFVPYSGLNSWADLSNRYTKLTTEDINISSDQTDAPFTLVFNAQGTSYFKTLFYTGVLWRINTDTDSMEPDGSYTFTILVKPMELRIPFNRFTVVTGATTDIAYTTATCRGTMTSDGGGGVTLGKFHIIGSIGVGEGATILQNYYTPEQDVVEGVEFLAYLTNLLPEINYSVEAIINNNRGEAIGEPTGFNTNGVTALPSESITRATTIIHRYVRKGPVYTMEVNLGGVTDELGIPEWADQPMYAIPPEVEAKPVIEPPPILPLPNLTVPSTITPETAKNLADQVRDLFKGYPLPTFPGGEHDIIQTPYTGIPTDYGEWGQGAGTMPGGTLVTCPYCGAEFNTYREYSAHYVLYHSF